MIRCLLGISIVLESFAPNKGSSPDEERIKH